MTFGGSEIYQPAFADHGFCARGANDPQFDALVDFVFNLGAGRLASSTLHTFCYE